MTLEERKRMIKELSKKYNIYISPRMIQRGMGLVHDSDSLTLFEKMDENTRLFAEKTILDLYSSSKRNDDEAQSHLGVSLVFDGDFSEFLENIGPIEDFIINNKDRFIAIYKYVESTEERTDYIGFYHKETIYNYGSIYLNFAKLLDFFDENDITYRIDLSIDRYTPSAFRDDTITNFVLKYNPKKELDEQEEQIIRRGK